ncbi:MAG: hypothetical protein ACRERU_00945 [Methylococcales bacterium]
MTKPTKTPMMLAVKAAQVNKKFSKRGEYMAVVGDEKFKEGSGPPADENHHRLPRIPR